MAADETVEKKSGKHIYGKVRFFSHIFKQPVLSVAFMMLSIITFIGKKSYPIAAEQIIKKENEKPEKDILPAKFKEKKEKKSVGRPKGSRNNAVNISFFMCNIAYILADEFKAFFLITKCKHLGNQSILLNGNDSK